MELKEKVSQAKQLDDEIETLKKQKEELEAKIKTVSEERDNLYLDLLEEAKKAKIEDQGFDNNLFLTYFSKLDVTWLDDEGLLKKLQENNALEFIKTVVKTTVSVDKKALKAAFKTNKHLREDYKPFYGYKKIEYVTVTTKQNHDKMIEHIVEHKDVK